MKWRLISAALVIVSLLAGLPWCPLGVATTFALSGLLIRAPLFIWYAANSTGLKQSAIFREIGFYVAASLFVAAALTFFRTQWVPSTSSASILAYWLLGVVLYGLVVLVTARSRKLLREGVKTITLIHKRSQATEPEIFTVQGSDAESAKR